MRAIITYPHVLLLIVVLHAVSTSLEFVPMVCDAWKNKRILSARMKSHTPPHSLHHTTTVDVPNTAASSHTSPLSIELDCLNVSGKHAAINSIVAASFFELLNQATLSLPMFTVESIAAFSKHGTEDFTEGGTDTDTVSSPSSTPSTGSVGRC